MKYNPEIHHRRSIRLRGYDYSQAGLYFITICCQNRECLFGEIVNGEMICNDAGKMINQIWHKIPQYHQTIVMDTFTIMPNHIHGIIEIKSVGADSISARSLDSRKRKRADIESAPTTLSTVMQSFKRYTTIEYIKMVKQQILPPFNQRIWQRNYWEHIVRDENEYQRISEYIINNPMKWDMDKLNGACQSQPKPSRRSHQKHHS